MAEKAPKIARNKDGTFPKGKTGNALGRPKGSKNQITLLRQSLELQLREQSNPQMTQVLDKAIELALEGDTRMIKLLLELHMSKQVPDSKEAKEKVQITINSDRPTEIKSTPQEPLEGEFTEIEDAEQ